MYENDSNAASGGFSRPVSRCSWHRRSPQRARRQASAEAVRIDADDIGGVVTGPKGPEAGVWVIAETTELPTRFVRIVVTDDRGQVRASRSAEGQLQRLGPRLRPGGFAEDAKRAGQDPRT